MIGLEAMLAALGPAANTFFETDGPLAAAATPPPPVCNTDTPVSNITTPVLCLFINDRARGHACSVRTCRRQLL